MVTGWPGRPRVRREKGVCVGPHGAGYYGRTNIESLLLPGRLKVVLMNYQAKHLGTGPAHGRSWLTGARTPHPPSWLESKYLYFLSMILS